MARIEREEMEKVKKLNESEKVYNAKGIKIKTFLLNNGLRIKWNNQDQIRGSLKIYREEGNFSKDKYNINGLLIADSDIRRGEGGETVDYIEKEKDYYYTINYETKIPTSFFGTLKEVGAKGIFDFYSKAIKFSEETEETESGSPFMHICRFSVRLPKEKVIEPPPQQSQPKTEMDRFKDELGKEVNKNKKIDMVDIELNKRIKAVEERAKQEGWSFERFERERDLEVARFQHFAQKNIK